MMKISVIVPVFNAEHYLTGNLEALSKQTFKDAEFLFVDNGSSDRSRKMIRTFIEKGNRISMKLLEEKKRGASAARNTGANHAAGEWLVFTDSDCLPDKNWLLDLEQEMHGEKRGAVVGTILPAPTKNIIGRFLGLFTLPANREKKEYDTFTLLSGGFPTANFAVQKEVFKKIGGFDEEILIYGEDHDLCYKIYEAGYTILALTNAKILHRHREGLVTMIKQTYGFGRSHALMLARLSGGCVIINFPFISKFRIGSGGRVWIDLNQADKKMAGLILIGIIHPLLFILSLLYLVYLGIFILKNARNKKMKITMLELPVFAVLLIIKSLALSMGRLFGSLKFKVLCV